MTCVSASKGRHLRTVVCHSAFASHWQVLRYLLFQGVVLWGHMQRREFITVLGGAAVTWPLAARAQQPAMPVVGFANGQSPSTFAYLVAAFREGLSQNGYVEGKSVSIEYRWAEGQESRMPALIDELVRKPVDVLAIGGSGRGPFLAKEFSSHLPVVVTDGGDPVRQGLVASLNRPGGNLTVVMVLPSLMA